MLPLHRESLTQPLVAERWFAGSYIVSGVYLIDGSELTPEGMIPDVEPMYRHLRKEKKARWPRGLAAFYLIPVYCARSFSEEVMTRARVRLPFSWAIWPEPVLYYSLENTFTLRSDFGMHGSAFYPYLLSLFDAGVVTAAKHFGHTTPPRQKETPNQAAQTTPGLRPSVSDP